MEFVSRSEWPCVFEVQTRANVPAEVSEAEVVVVVDVTTGSNSAVCFVGTELMQPIFVCVVLS